MATLHRRFLWVASAALLLIIAVSFLVQRTPRLYPYVVVQVTDSLRVTFLHHAQPDDASCAAFADRVANAVVALCHRCQLIEKRCLERLTPRQRNMLSAKMLDIPAIHIPGGSIAFEGDSSPLGLQLCLETQRQAQNYSAPAECIPATNDVFGVSTDNRYKDLIPKGQALAAVALLAAVMSCFMCYLLIYSERFHARFSHDTIGSGPQKFHATPTPRIGGMAIAFGLVGSVLLLGSFAGIRPTAVYGISLLALAAVPSFAGGLAEDLTKRVGILARLMLTFSAALIAALVFGAVIERSGIMLVDHLLQWPVFAIAFTVFAVGGVANAINIIDGYNGLAGGYAILVLGALAWVSAQVGDQLLLISSLAMFGALIGFLIWNYPRGKIFMGDGGAYLVGFWLAELSILLVLRNTDVSAWFPVVLLIYPIAETSVSVYRKKVVRGMSPGQPDRLHLHMLIHQRLVRINVGSKDLREITYRNNLVALYVWSGVAVIIVPSLFFWRNTVILACLATVFCLAYLWLYSRLLRWRAPVWMVKLPNAYIQRKDSHG